MNERINNTGWDTSAPVSGIRFIIFLDFSFLRLTLFLVFPESCYQFFKTLRLIFIKIFFVHLFDHLKRENHVANLIGLAVPNQLHLPLIFKQQKSVFLRQRFAFLKIPINIPYLIIRQFHLPAFSVPSHIFLSISFF